MRGKGACDAHSSSSSRSSSRCGSWTGSRRHDEDRLDQAGGVLPATVSIVAGDSIRWRNDDTQNHQIVSTTGAFASPVLARGKTYTFRFDVAGTYRYRDALNPSVTGTVRVAGAPPAVTLGTSQPQIAYGRR